MFDFDQQRVFVATVEELLAIKPGKHQDPFVNLAEFPNFMGLIQPFKSDMQPYTGNNIYVREGTAKRLNQAINMLMILVAN